MSYVSALPTEVGVDARALRELAQTPAPERGRRAAERAERTSAQKLRRFAAIQVTLLTATMFVASALVLDLGGMTLAPSQAQTGVVTAAGMTAARPQPQKDVVRLGRNQANTVLVIADVMGFTLTIPMRDPAI